jgi:hypothetical protein
MVVKGTKELFREILLAELPM